MAFGTSLFREGLEKLEQDSATSVLLKTYNNLHGNFIRIETIYKACNMTDEYIKELIKQKSFAKRLSRKSAKLGSRLNYLLDMTDEMLTDTSMLLEDIDVHNNAELPGFFAPRDDQPSCSVDEQCEYEKFKKYMLKYVEKENVKHTIPSPEEQSELLDEIAASSDHSAFILSTNSNMSVMSNKEEDKSFNT